MTALTIANPPEDLHDPILVTAFFGWNDAAEAATDALRYLRSLAQAKAFAEIDPDEFFVFTEHRPKVKWIDGDEPRREVIWPITDFTTLSLPAGERRGRRDFVLGLGHEPDLRWREFCRCVLEVADAVGASEIVTLGALLADVAHTRPTKVTAGSSSPERNRELGFEGSRYEGPTGIVGALGDACRRGGADDAAHVSLWASVPHYVTSRHNPGATKAILDQLDRIYDLGLDLSHLDKAMERYRTQIDSALDDKPDVREYVRTLEEQADAETVRQGTGESQLESSSVLEEIDRLLKGGD